MIVVDVATVVAGVAQLALRADLLQQLAVEAVAADGVPAVVDEEHLVAAGHEHPVGAVAEHALAPGVDEVPVAVVDHHRMVATAVEKDVAARVGADRRDVGVLPSARQLFPTLDEFELQRSRPEPRSHGVPRSRSLATACAWVASSVPIRRFATGGGSVTRDGANVQG